MRLWQQPGSRRFGDFLGFGFAFVFVTLTFYFANLDKLIHLGLLGLNVSGTVAELMSILSSLLRPAISPIWRNVSTSIALYGGTGET